MQSTMLSSQTNGVTPFRAGTAGRSSLACRSSRDRAAVRVSKTVASSASVEPKKLSQAAIAAFAAGCIALSGPAYATESGILPSRNRDEDNAARAMIDRKEAENKTSPERQEDKNSGNVNTFKVAGVQQADAREPKGKYPMKGPNEKASLEEQLETLPPTRGNPNSEAASQLDPREALKKANDRSAPVSFSLGAPSLQFNVGVFGTGDVGTMKDQIKDTQDGAKAALSNPLEAAEQTADRTQRAANKILVNPAGGEQSKAAAEQLSEANAEIPKALGKGFSDLKKQLTQPTSTTAFGAASLLHTTNMQGDDFQTLQRNVRVGDLQSITGGQAKKAGPEEVVKADSTGNSDAQLITNESTSGVKARGASGNPKDSGAADRAASRVDKLTDDKTAIP